MKSGSIRITIYRQHGGQLPLLRGFKTQLRRVVQILGATRGQWAISLVRDRKMAQLHAQTMQIPTTTDVLTFNLADYTSANPRSARFSLDLDTVICVDEARRQAAARGHKVAKEILLYAIHSLLHVCGYDDLTPLEARRMHRREDALLLELGVGAVYGRPAALKPVDAGGTDHRRDARATKRPRKDH